VSVAGVRLVIWDFDGTLAHRRGSCSAETGYEKPHERAFASVLEQLRPAQAWMVGDNVVADVLGAGAVGIPAVLVRRPDPRAARFADSLLAVEPFLGEAVAA
jgi:FMN phosphatase YigB (HAD superfamily)